MPQLRIKNGPQKATVVQIEGDKPIIIGRDPTTSLQIIDKGVSREHAEVFRVGEMVFIRDLGSRNGTFVNEEQMEEELLREGDTIRLGSTQLVFESSNKAAEKDVEYEEGAEFKTSLELKVEDLFVGEGDVGRAGEHFRAICQATQVMSRHRDEDELFSHLLDLIQEFIPADHIYLFLKDEDTGAIVPRATRQKGETTQIPISRTILKRVITEARSILTADAMQDERFKTGDSIVMHQIRSVLCVPVSTGRTTLGALYAVNARLAETFDQSDLELLTAVCTQLGAHLVSLSATRGRRRMFMGLLCAMSRLLEAASGEMKGHAERVGNCAAVIARQMNVEDLDILRVTLAGYLHDLGKLKTVQAEAGQEVDPKKGDPHVLIGTLFLEKLPGLTEVVTLVRSHHERFDGRGTPVGLKGDSIPLGARILAVANAFDHLLYDENKIEPGAEPDPSDVRKAFTELGNRAGEQFDVDVVRALMVAYRHGKLYASKDTPTATAATPSTEDVAEGETWAPQARSAKNDEAPAT
ncbi:MAG: FHA domain-containing protein [Planctomycetota bacterium]|nr:FHA domain-containing protein [Planctomycetota bacterium]